MIAEIKIPKIIQTKDPIKLVTWYVKDGDLVKEGDALCLLETSKASMELPAEKPGYVKLLKKQGDNVTFEDTLCLIADNIEDLK